MLVVTLLAMSLSLIPMASGTPEGCSPAERQLGFCTTNTGTSIIVGGSQTTPGSGGGTGPSQAPSQPQLPATPQPSPAPVAPWCAIDDPAIIYVDLCVGDEEDDFFPAVTISDLARFTPPGSPLTIEPFNIGIVGLHSNFVAASGVRNVSGTLFGASVTVRFTPDLHRFHYGDGAQRTVATPGRSWTVAGEAQFTPTTTSHAYSARGDYLARVDTLYTAYVNFGYGWIYVPGHVTARGPDEPIRVYEARTALVAHTCDELPGAPGC